MKRVLCAIALSLAAALPAHAAEKCTLLQIAALKLKPLPNSGYTIPVSIGGVERDFELSLNAPFSAISGTVADAQGYKTFDLRGGSAVRLNGEEIKRRVVVGDLNIGVSHGKDFQMLRADKPFPGQNVAGMIGLDLLENFDVELNLSARELKLFAHTDCDGKAYWTTASYAVANIEEDASSHIAFRMLLDDTGLTVDLGLSDGPSFIDMNTLKRMFHLAPDSPGMTSETDGHDTNWHYPFKTLSLDGVVINHPNIVILQDDGPECRADVPLYNTPQNRCYGSSNLHVYGDVLKALHLYFAFKDKQVYITAADAKK